MSHQFNAFENGINLKIRAFQTQEKELRQLLS